MEIAIAHDSFTQMGGAERIVDALHELYPGAPVFTLVFDQKYAAKYKGWDIRTSWLQVLYKFIPKFQYLLPLIPLAVKSLDFTGYDIVISSSSGFIKNISTPKNCVHINYCHTPTRFIWIDKDYVNQEVAPILRPFVKLFLKFLKKWDYNGAQKVHKFIANSNEVGIRIKEYYHKNCELVYPFVNTNFWHPTKTKLDYFLLAGRLQPHKRNQLVIETFNEIGLPLRVVGSGRQEKFLKSIAGPNISFFGQVSDEELRDHYSSAIGLIYPQIEDFGLMPLEAAACGTATLAFGKGGALETILPGKTGDFFFNYDKQSLKTALLNWQQNKFTKENLFEQANKFKIDAFKTRILKIVNNSVQPR